MASPSPIGDHALESLRVIRDAMERAGSFTAVPGWGTVAVGVLALTAAPVAASMPDKAAWLTVWLAVGAVAVVVSAALIARKAKRLGLSLASGVSRRFALAFVPALAAGAVMTWVLAVHGLGELLPGTWLLLYGTAVVAGGALSVRIVPLMGFAFMAIGALTLALPHGWGDTMMAIGFGGVHVLFGTAIARRHGG
jgi:prepilin signal peptidase PulO-like enzyme (type II secretory pathway)